MKPAVTLTKLTEIVLTSILYIWNRIPAHELAPTLATHSTVCHAGRFLCTLN